MELVKIKASGQNVSVGTCLSMYQLRAQQIIEVERANGHNVDIMNYWHRLFYRFPFPDEDGRQPGNLGEDYDRKLIIPTMRLSALGDASLMQHSRKDCEADPMVAIQQQTYAVEEDNGPTPYVAHTPLHLVCVCPTCDASYELEWEDATQVAARCQMLGEMAENCGSELAKEGADFWKQVALRIVEGYHPQPPIIEAAPAEPKPLEVQAPTLPQPEAKAETETEDDLGQLTIHDLLTMLENQAMCKAKQEVILSNTLWINPQNPRAVTERADIKATEAAIIKTREEIIKRTVR